ncbi:hypothetical protein ABZP36_010022 [Zizania latifolia]
MVSLVPIYCLPRGDFPHVPNKLGRDCLAAMSHRTRCNTTEKGRRILSWLLGSDGRVLALALAFRAVNALLVRTYFNPDEHWQCLEVALRISFGYGHLSCSSLLLFTRLWPCSTWIPHGLW